MLDSSLSVKKTVAATGVKAPTITGGSSGGGGTASTPKIAINGLKNPIDEIQVNVGDLKDETEAKKSLPSMVTLLVDNKEIKDVTAKIGDWKIKNGTFDGNTAGSYTFVGTVKIPDGYAYSNSTLTVTALNYTDSNGSTVNLGQEVATYTCTVGAPVSKADELPTLLTSGKDKANLYIRLKGTGTASVITVSDEADISAEETVNSSNSRLFQDSISVGSATTETDTTPPNFVVFLGMTVTSEQLSAVAVNSLIPHKTTSVTFTIPSDKVSLTNEGKTAGWYIPQGGLKLTAEDMRVYQPKVLAEKASVADTTVTVPLQVLFLNEGKTLNVALVPTSTTSYDGKDNNAISGTDMRNTESKEQHYYFALSGSQKYEYRIPIRCYTATFDNVTAGTYAVWIQVDDTDTWVKAGDSITVGNTAGRDSDNTGNPTTE